MNHRRFSTAFLSFGALLAATVTANNAEAGRWHGHSHEPQVQYCNAPKVCCGSPVKYVLAVRHPCTGCQIAVEVCLPSCCKDTPAVLSRGTFFGCGLTRYTWCCGRSVTIRYQKCGDVKVVYR